MVCRLEWVAHHDDEQDRLIRSESLRTERLALRPLQPDDAATMTETLSDPAIYEYIGGEPPTEAELRSRYEFLAGERSPAGTQSWLNWIVWEDATSAAVGVMQATVIDGSTAHVAWTIAPRWQGRGYAREAAVAVISWLGNRSVELVIAHIHPEHEASRRVAEAAGLEETDCLNDGEQRWERHLLATQRTVD